MSNYASWVHDQWTVELERDPRETTRPHVGPIWAVKGDLGYVGIIWRQPVRRDGGRSPVVRWRAEHRDGLALLETTFRTRMEAADALVDAERHRPEEDDAEAEN